MTTPKTREEFEASKFYQAGAQAAREKQSLRKAVACMLPGCWQYDAFVQGFDSVKAHEQRIERLRQALRDKYGAGKYRITGTYLTEQVHAYGVMPNTNQEGFFLLGTLTDAEERLGITD